MKKNFLKIPMFLALDVDDLERAREIAKSVSAYVGGYKVGPRLLMRYGSSIVKELSEYAPVFVDNKYLDIPSTMVSAVQASFDAGASFVTVHASAGSEALRELKALEDDLNKERDFKILAVTVLTSFHQETLPANWKNASIADHVVALAEEVLESGLTGLVCSAHEAGALRERFSGSYLVTPGIRFMNESQGDQKRVMGPAEAIASGASAIVVGRPICAADDPIAVAKSYHLALTEK